MGSVAFGGTPALIAKSAHTPLPGHSPFGMAGSRENTNRRFSFLKSPLPMHTFQQCLGVPLCLLWLITGVKSQV